MFLLSNINIRMTFWFILSLSSVYASQKCKANTDCSYTCYMGQDLCYMEHTFPGESDEGFCMGGTVFSDGTCEKKRSLGESCVDHDNNHCVTRLCDDSNTCRQRTSGCASFSDCIGAAVDSGKDFFQTEISGEVEVYTDYWGSEYQVDELTQVCNFPSGGPNCPSQPCHGYGRLRHGESRRRLTDLDLVDSNTPGHKLSRRLFQMLKESKDGKGRRLTSNDRILIVDTIEQIKNLLENGLVIDEEVDTCFEIVKNGEFLQRERECRDNPHNHSWFYSSRDTTCRAEGCEATGTVKLCVHGPMSYRLTPNLKFDLTTFNFGIGAGFLFDASGLRTTITSTGSTNCFLDRDWTLSSRYNLFRKPVKFGAVSIMIEVSGQLTTRLQGDFNASGNTEFELQFNEAEFADSFLLGLDMEDSENCLNTRGSADIPEPPELPETGPEEESHASSPFRRVSETGEELEECEPGEGARRSLYDGILGPRHRKLLIPQLSPTINHLKSEAEASLNLKVGIMGELSLVVNGVESEVGVGGDISVAAKAAGDSSNGNFDDDNWGVCLPAAAEMNGGIKIGMFIPSFDLMDTIATFGKTQCSEALGFLADIRQRRLTELNVTDSEKYIEGLRKYSLRKGLRERLLSDRFGTECQFSQAARDEIQSKLKIDSGRIDICGNLVDFALGIIGDPNICIEEYSSCDTLFRLDKITLADIGCSNGESITTGLGEYKCEPFETHIENVSDTYCEGLNWWKIIILVLLGLCVCGICLVKLRIINC